MSNNIEILGQSNIPDSGCLVIPGRLNFSELTHLKNTLSGRTLTWLCEESISLCKDSRQLLEQDSVTAISFSSDDEHPAALGENLHSYIEGQGVIIYLPGEVSAPHAETSHIPAKTIQLLCALKLPVLPLAVSRPAEIATVSEKANSLASAVFSFGNLITAEKVSASIWQQELYAADEIAFSKRAFLQYSLAETIIAGLKKHGASTTLFDGSDDSATTFDKLLGAAIALSKEISKQTKKKRVGIILPPGKGGMLANLAVIFAGKVPVNINFTASHKAILSTIKQADIDKSVTADPFMRKMSSFPWPANRDLIFIERTLPNIKKQIKRWVLLSKILPSSMISKMIGLGESSGDDEAVLLFTSGSSGDPKGVPLSHRNILANVHQFGSRINLSKSSRVLGCLPLFHSFGSTVTLWYPCIHGMDLVTYPSPLETKRLGDLISEHGVSMILSTPTFLRGYIRRVKPEQLESVQYVVTGAEKLPSSLAEKFHEKFNIFPMEGYGLTETSPATNLNIPTADKKEGLTRIKSNKFGSVGKFLPGIAVKITNPNDGSLSPIDTQGAIWLRGANVFSGYLNNEEKTKEVIQDGWFNTGDIGRVDHDGFLYIEGRLSRFSKIAGEMVPHETLEETITKTLGLEQDTERRIAVVGIPDAQKGEAIALLSTVCGDTLEQECIDLRYKLMDTGLPSLWCPKIFIPVDEIPILASGKLDIKGCQTLADEYLSNN